ncbi:MAG TPA: guanylate kinase [Gemmatimonadales bacterium]
MRPFLLVLSSPSGGGKSTITRRLLAERTDVGYSVSATTRAPRAGEQDGVHYHFLTPEEFAGREAAGEFIEAATYGGFRYGTLRSEVERVLASRRHVLLDIEVDGARQVRQAAPDSVHVFLLPPSAAILAERLQGRNTEDGAALSRRMEIADRELASVAAYDYLVVNDNLAEAVKQVGAIIDAESRRVNRLTHLDETVSRLRQELGTNTRSRNSEQ